MKVYVASIVTETNTFASAPTGAAAFERYGDGLVARLTALASTDGDEVVVGPMWIAQPGGPTVRRAYEALRDGILDGLRDAMPVDAVVMPLHGAMVADGYPDCEGDLVARVRGVVGPGVPIGVELDLHCHFTMRLKDDADVVVAYKEYPHTDVEERLDEVWRLTLATARGDVRPTTAVFDCRMVNLWHTTRDPMRSFVAEMSALEGADGVLSVSFGHGFPWGDVPEAGAKVWVITDGDPQLAATIAERLGRRLWAMRSATDARPQPLASAIERLLTASGHGPIVVADVADNAGGGASSDSTFVLEALVVAGIGDVAIGAFWDLGAIRLCRDAGEGAVLDLRVGGKCGPASGRPVDLRVTVVAIRDDHSQVDVEQGRASCGPSVRVRTADGIDLVLISRRQQVMGTDLFTGLGIDLRTKRAIVVKSSQHFHAAFAPIAADVLYVDTPGLLRSDFQNFDYRYRGPNFWPRVEDPFRRAD